jgi:hypothetical protein
MEAHRPLVPLLAGLAQGAKGAERGCFFRRIGERPILRKVQAFGHIDMPEKRRTFDLPRVLLGANQKRFPLCDLRDFAVKFVRAATVPPQKESFIWRPLTAK